MGGRPVTAVLLVWVGCAVVVFLLLLAPARRRHRDTVLEAHIATALRLCQDAHPAGRWGAGGVPVEDRADWPGAA